MKKIYTFDNYQTVRYTMSVEAHNEEEALDKVQDKFSEYEERLSDDVVATCTSMNVSRQFIDNDFQILKAGNIEGDLEDEI